MCKNDSYWWYITITGDASSEDVLFSLADITESIGTELQELPDGAFRLRMYYRSSHDVSHWKKLLASVMKDWVSAVSVRIEDFGKIENQPWNTAAEDAFPPLCVGENLVVLAPWHKGKEPNDRIPLYINPGSAFGTGYHESTQIALELLEKYITKGAVSTDIGTGSGILTIGALKMGAAKAYVRDIDPAVIDEAMKNFELNSLDTKNIDIKTGDLLKDFGHKADILTANILLDPLVTMLCDVTPVIGSFGVAVFSGMLEKERDVFLKALSDAKMEPILELVKGEWWGVAAKASA